MEGSFNLAEKWQYRVISDWVPIVLPLKETEAPDTTSFEAPRFLVLCPGALEINSGLPVTSGESSGLIPGTENFVNGFTRTLWLQLEAA